VAEDAEGKLVAPGDLAAQARQAFANVGLALAAAGARPEQVARITIYVVDHRPEYLPDISAARIAVFGDHRPADTCASLLFEAGRNVRQVADWLDHADPSFTLRTYVHLMDEGIGDAEFMDQAVGGSPPPGLTLGAPWPARPT
jgi:integrase